MKATLLLLTLGLAAHSSAPAAETWWPQFRGPNCSGVSDTARPPAEFGPGKNQLWKVAVPSGLSSPCVWGDRLFLTAFADGKLETRAHARRDGKLLWQRVVPAAQLEEFHQSEGSPAASTCATDGQRVVSYFGSFGLICHDFAGQELWRHPLPRAETAGGFGSGASPTLAGGLVLLNRDLLRGCSLLAVDVQTGKQVWETPRPDVTQSFGSAITWKNQGVDEVVMSGSLKLKGYDLRTGKERWSYTGLPSFTCTTPVLGDGLLFFGGWSPGKSDAPMPTFAQLAAGLDKNKDGAITPDEAKGTDLEPFFRAQDFNGDGKITAEDLEGLKSMMAKGENLLVAFKPGLAGEVSAGQVAWKQSRGLPYVPSPVLYQGRIYLVKDGGLASSFEAKTGQIHYQQERLDAIGGYYASPIAADGRIFVASLNGKLTAFAAGGDLPKVTHQADFGERLAATPAVVGNVLYVRTPKALYAFGQ